MELNELEVIGLAFRCGFVAGTSFKESEKEIEKDIKIEIGKVEGKDAEKFMKFIEKITKEGGEING